jgi:hypothetical protein
MRIMVGVGELVQMTGDGQAHVGYSVAEQSRGQVMLCAVCTVHEGMRSANFFVKAQNQGRQFASGLGLKPLGRFFSVWPQNRWCGFHSLSLKIGSYGLVIYDLSVVPQNRQEEDGAGHVSRSSGLFCLEASQARVSQFCHKTSGGTTAGGAHGIITKVAWM